MTAGVIRGGACLGLAALGLIAALGPLPGHTEPVAGPRTAQRVYEVQPGDTLTSLAKRVRRDRGHDREGEQVAQRRLPG